MFGVGFSLTLAGVDVMLVPDHQGKSEASAPDPAPGPGINIVILDSS